VWEVEGMEKQQCSVFGIFKACRRLLRRHLLVMCNSTAEDLSEADKTIAAEFFKLLIVPSEGDDGADMHVMRLNFDGSPTLEGNFLLYLNPSNHVIKVPMSKKTNMEFEKFYDFSSCLGSLVSIFLNIVPIQNCTYWRNQKNTKKIMTKRRRKRKIVLSVS
jgi:hypothetical protein